jgi:ketosteroid isomerase-like protein
MADREANVALARTGIEAFNRGDAAVVAAMLHPEIEVHVTDAMVNPGTWHGLDGFAEGIGGWNDAWDDLRFEILEIEAVDDRHVLVFVHQTAVGPGSGVPVEMDAVLMFEVEDGRARRFHVHRDREAAEAAI